MRQAVLTEPKKIEFRNIDAPKAEDLQAHQVLIKVRRIGIWRNAWHNATTICKCSVY